MIKNILLAGLTYFAWQQWTNSQAAQADRAALLNILTPDQQAALLKSVEAVAKGAVTGAVSAVTGK